MPRELVAIQVGQCGNQVGSEFWKKLCHEHGIGMDGLLIDEASEKCDRKDVFFYQADDDKYVPRALLVDLEPGVINGIKNSTHGALFNHENMYIHPEGAGAGNSWSQGYYQSEEVYEEILEMIDREADNSDSLEGFMLMHSVAGGTGSGLGSYLLEALSDRYPKKLIQTYSVFPSRGAEEVIVHPYNTMLSLQRLINNVDATVIVENSALNRIFGDKLRIKNPSDEETNSLISTVMAATTNTLRFPGFMNNDLVGLVSPLVPTPKAHFLTTGYTPFTSARQESRVIRKTSVLNVMKRLLDPQNIMTSTNTRKGLYISALNIIEGDVDPLDLHKSLQTINDKRLASFVPWGPQSIQVALSQRSPYSQASNRISGLMLANHTSIRSLFEEVMASYQKLRKRKAFLQNYTKEDRFELSEFDVALETVRAMVEEYQQMEKENYLSSLSA